MTSAARNRSIAPFSKPDSIDVSQGAKASTSNSADASRDRRRGNRAKAISQPGDHQLARWRSVAVRFGGGAPSAWTAACPPTGHAANLDEILVRQRSAGK